VPLEGVKRQQRLADERDRRREFDSPEPIGYRARVPTADELTRMQKNQWGAVASGWERWTDWLEEQSGGLARLLCEEAAVAPGRQILDLACGGGGPATTAARLVLPNGRVSATDISPEMVAATERRVAKLGLTNVDVREMDAQRLTFPDESFDAAICRFGLMFCPDPVLAAAEIRRVLRSGARFALAVWDEPARNPFFTILTGVLGRFMEVPPFDPTVPGPYRLSPPGELATVLAAGGFADIEVTPHPMTWTYPSLEMYWEIQTDIAAPLRAALQRIGAADPADLPKVKAAVLEALAPFTRDGIVRLPATALRARAAR
jgi:enediyne biosynthesis protein CalE5